jgi:phosphate transport system protein
MTWHFKTETAQICGKLVEIGVSTDDLIKRSIQILVERNGLSAMKIQSATEAVVEKTLELDEDCLQLLAEASGKVEDVRFLVSALRITGDLRRIIAEVDKIVKSATILIDRPDLKSPGDIPSVVGVASSMIRDSLIAFARKDLDLAKSVLKRNRQVNAYENQIFRVLLTYMFSDSNSFDPRAELILISRHIQRIADYGANMAETAIHYSEGYHIQVE